MALPPGVADDLQQHQRVQRQEQDGRHEAAQHLEQGSLRLVAAHVLFDGVPRVVDRDDAQQHAVLVHHGHGGQLVLEDVGRHVLLGLVRRRGDHVVEHHVAHGPRVVGEHEGAQAQHAHELVVVVQHVHVMHGGVVVVQLAQHLDGLAHGVVGLHGHELRGHHAAGRAVLVAQQAADLGGVLHAHEAQQRLGLLVRQVAHDVGRVVRVHVAQKAGGASVVEVFDEVGLVLVVHLGDGLGGLRVVQMLEHVGALLGVQLLQDVGHVGGVQLVQALVRDGQLHLGQVAIEQVHVVPGDDLLVDLLAEHLRHGHHGALQPGGQSAQDAAHAHLGTEEAQLVVAGEGELEVVHAHDLHALRVDDLAVQQVAGEQDLVGLQIAEADVVRLGVEGDPVLVERVDVLAPRDHERNLAGPLEGQAGDAREHFAGGDSEVGNGADLLALGVHDGFPHHLREVEHGGIPYCHAHGRTPHDTVCKDARVARNAKCVSSHEPPQSFLRLPT